MLKYSQVGVGWWEGAADARRLEGDIRRIRRLLLYGLNIILGNHMELVGCSLEGTHQALI